jgi:hypothetical protein
MRDDWWLVRTKQRAGGRLGLKFGGPHRVANLVLVRVSVNGARRHITMINAVAPVLAPLAVQNGSGAIVSLTGLAGLVEGFGQVPVPDTDGCRFSMSGPDSVVGETDLPVRWPEPDDPEMELFSVALDSLAIPDEAQRYALAIRRPDGGVDVVEHWPSARTATAGGALTAMLDVLDIVRRVDEGIDDLCPGVRSSTSCVGNVVNRWRATVKPLYLHGAGVHRSTVLAMTMSSSDGSRIVVADTFSPALDAFETVGDEQTKRVGAEPTVAFLVSRLAGLPRAAEPDPLAWHVRVGDDELTLPVATQENSCVVSGCRDSFDPDQLVARGMQVRLTVGGTAHVIEYWPSPAVSPHVYDLLASAVQVLTILGRLEPNQVKLAHPAPRTLEPADTVSLLTCLPETLDRARELLGTPLSSDVDGQAEARAVLQQMLMDPQDNDRCGWVVRHHHADADTIAGLRQGKSALAILVAETLVGQACAAEDNGDPESDRAFATALTAYLRAHVGENANNRPRITSRVCNLIFEWITQTFHRPFPQRVALDLSRSSATAMDRFNRLVLLAPWFEYLVKKRPLSNKVRISLAPHDLLTLLATIRPRTTYVGATGQSRYGEVRRLAASGLDVARLTASYDLDAGFLAAVDQHRWLADDLARAAEKMFYAPNEALRAVQVLEPLGELARLVNDYATSAVAAREATLSDAAVLVDSPPGLPPRPVLINTNPIGRLSADLGGFALELAEFAPGTLHAVNYTTTPIWLSDPSGPLPLTAGEDSCPVNLPQREAVRRGSDPATEWVDESLFRGRKDQLAVLTGIMRPDVSQRLPVAVFGPRRAGKTTLAVHACRQGIRLGLVENFIKIDMYVDVDGTKPDGYAERFAEVLVKAFRAKFDLDLDAATRDPIAVLIEADKVLQQRGTGAVVLDEFDTLLSADEGSDLHNLALRLGSLTWTSIVLIATVQRFHRDAANMSTWQFVECPADLSWTECLTYFCPQLVGLPKVSDGVVVLDAPVVLPRNVRDVVSERLGFRPYFWGRLRQQLENYLVADGRYAVADRDTLEHIINGFVEADPFLCLPSQDTAGVSQAECRRRDLYSQEEKRILAHMAMTGTTSITEKDAREIGGVEAVLELIDRAHLRRDPDQLRLAVPLFGEYLERHSLYFAAFSTVEPAYDEF